MIKSSQMKKVFNHNNKFIAKSGVMVLYTKILLLELTVPGVLLENH